MQRFSKWLLFLWLLVGGVRYSYPLLQFPTVQNQWAMVRGGVWVRWMQSCSMYMSSCFDGFFCVHIHLCMLCYCLLVWHLFFSCLTADRLVLSCLTNFIHYRWNVCVTTDLLSRSCNFRHFLFFVTCKQQTFRCWYDDLLLLQHWFTCHSLHLTPFSAHNEMQHSIKLVFSLRMCSSRPPEFNISIFKAANCVHPAPLGALKTRTGNHGDHCLMEIK